MPDIVVHLKVTTEFPSTWRHITLLKAMEGAYTLWCQLEDTVLLISTLLLFDPVLFPKYEADY